MSVSSLEMPRVLAMEQQAIGTSVARETADLLRAPRHLPLLDWVRGIAGVMMVVNHAVHLWLQPAAIGSTPIRELEFIGSFAPVVFFFATGIGYGWGWVPAQAGSFHRFGLGRKVLVLLLADAMLWMTRDTWWGVNFFGFIAISMLLLEPLRYARRPAALAAAAWVVVVAARYLLGPIVTRDMEEAGSNVLAILFGTGCPRHLYIAYPLLPWLAFPLAGFLCGLGLRQLNLSKRPRIATQVGILVVVATACAMMASIMVMRGGVLFRWGSMSAAYFAAAWACLAVTLASALVVFSVDRLRPALGWLSLRGVQSFAFVPIHFLVISACTTVGWSQFGVTRFVLWVLLALLLSFAGASAFAAFAHRARDIGAARLWVCAGVAILVTIALRLGIDSELSTVSGAAGRFSQLVLCLLLVAGTPTGKAAPEKPTFGIHSSVAVARRQ